MARARNSLLTPSVDPSLPEVSPPSSTSPRPSPMIGHSTVQPFLQELQNCLRPLTPTDLARLGGPGLYDLGFPDPLGYLNMTVEDLGTKLREHITAPGTDCQLKTRYEWIAAELHINSTLSAPQHCLTILLRLALAELFVQRCALAWE